MELSLQISIIGAVSALAVSLIGAILVNYNNIRLQTRKLKEDHYVAYIEALHNLCANNNIEKYVFARDKLFLIASEDVINKMVNYENNGVGNVQEIHDKYLTELIMALRKDLKIKDKSKFPIYFKQK